MFEQWALLNTIKQSTLNASGHPQKHHKPFLKKEAASNIQQDSANFHMGLTGNTFVFEQR